MAKINDKTPANIYDVGDWVLLKDSQNTMGNPLLGEWKGPYVVNKIPSKDSTIIEIENHDKRFNNNLLKLYVN